MHSGGRHFLSGEHAQNDRQESFDLTMRRFAGLGAHQLARYRFP